MDNFPGAESEEPAPVNARKMMPSDVAGGGWKGSVITMSCRNLKRGFALLEILYWLTYGSFTTYLVSFVTATRGASASVAGLMLALLMASACIGQFVIGGICDRMQNNRVVFMAGMAATVVLCLCVYFSPNMILMGVACVALGFIQSPTGAILDTWLIRSFPDEPGAYSPLRSLASLAYAVLMTVMGLSIERFGHVAMPVFVTIFGALNVFAAYKMPEIPRVAVSTEKGHGGAGLRTLPVVVWLFVLSMAFMGMANMPLLNMNVLILERVGGTVASMGIATSFNTVAEFLVMRFPRPYMRFSARQRLIGAALLYVFSTAMMIFAGTVWLLYIAFFINGVAYGLMLPARRQFVTEVAPPEMQNRVQALGDMAYLDFGGLVGNQLSGVLIDSKGGVPMMVTVALAEEVASLAFMLRMKGSTKKTKEPGAAA